MNPQNHSKFRRLDGCRFTFLTLFCLIQSLCSLSSSRQLFSVGKKLWCKWWRSEAGGLNVGSGLKAGGSGRAGTEGLSVWTAALLHFEGDSSIQLAFLSAVHLPPSSSSPSVCLSAHMLTFTQWQTNRGQQTHYCWIQWLLHIDRTCFRVVILHKYPQKGCCKLVVILQKKLNTSDQHKRFFVGYN